MPILIRLEGESPGSPQRSIGFWVGQGRATIGRDPTRDLLLQDAMVSRLHATLEVRGERAALTDHRSRNGTFVDGLRITGPVELGDGQLIVIGSACFRFIARAP